MNSLNFPYLDDAFLADLVLQRTGDFLKIDDAQEVLSSWFETGDKSPIPKFLKEKKLVNSFLDQAVSSAATDAASIATILGVSGASKLVSIGPGNGLVEALLAKRTGAKELLLIDIESSSEHCHGFATKGAGYASLRRAAQLIESNVSHTIKIVTCNPTTEKLPEFLFSGVISILSMGFHYPCDDYADFLLENSREDSQIILDKRLGVTDKGFDKLCDSYSLRAIERHRKFVRLQLRKGELSYEPNRFFEKS